MRAAFGSSSLQPLSTLSFRHPVSFISSNLSFWSFFPSWKGWDEAPVSSSSPAMPVAGSSLHRERLPTRRTSKGGFSCTGFSLNTGDDSTVCNARKSVFAELQELQEKGDDGDNLLAFETPLAVILYPDPRLRAINKRINTFNEKLEKLVEEMFEVMYNTDGVGLSAPQVGVNVQLMVFNPEGEKGKGEEIVLVNPKIYKYGNKRYLYTEGCLSFPGIDADVERPASVRIEAQDIRGKKFSLNLKEFAARIFQHEYDHLQSTLYFERMTPEVRESIIPQLEKLENEYEERTGLPAPERIRNSKGG